MLMTTPVGGVIEECYSTIMKSGERERREQLLIIRMEDGLCKTEARHPFLSIRILFLDSSSSRSMSTTDTVQQM